MAANLDVAAWAEHHGYTPLSGSLSPADDFSVTAAIPQRHYVAANDEAVPAALTTKHADVLPRDSIRVLPHYDHACCWEEAWPDLLDEALSAFE